MAKISFIICNSGDGSNHLIWLKGAVTREMAEQLEEQDPEMYSSGDGVQVTVLDFPDEFSIDGWAGINYISFATVEELLTGNY